MAETTGLLRENYKNKWVPSSESTPKNEKNGEKEPSGFLWLSIHVSDRAPWGSALADFTEACYLKVKQSSAWDPPIRPPSPPVLNQSLKASRCCSFSILSASGALQQERGRDQEGSLPCGISPKVHLSEIHVQQCWRVCSDQNIHHAESSWVMPFPFFLKKTQPRLVPKCSAPQVPRGDELGDGHTQEPETWITTNPFQERAEGGRRQALHRLEDTSEGPMLWIKGCLEMKWTPPASLPLDPDAKKTEMHQPGCSHCAYGLFMGMTHCNLRNWGPSTQGRGKTPLRGCIVSDQKQLLVLPLSWINACEEEEKMKEKGKRRWKKKKRNKREW